TEDPKLAKGIVRREVVETITPGAAFADDLLDGSRNNYLCAVKKADGNCGIAAIDLSTGEFRLATVSAADANAVLARFAPREILVESGPAFEGLGGITSSGEDPLATQRDSWHFDAAL